MLMYLGCRNQSEDKPAPAAGASASACVQDGVDGRLHSHTLCSRRAQRRQTRKKDAHCNRKHMYYTPR